MCVCGSLNPNHDTKALSAVFDHDKGTPAVEHYMYHDFSKRKIIL